METKEEWAPIPGHESYLISTHGRIINTKFKRKPGKEYKVAEFHEYGKLLKPQKQRLGYISIRFKDGEYYQYLMHRLVLMTFKPIEFMEFNTCNHLDMDKANNHIDNLEWLNLSDNIQHSWRNGRNRIYKGKPQHKEILDLADQGLTRQQIADKLNCKYMLVWQRLNKLHPHYMVLDKKHNKTVTV